MLHVKIGYTCADWVSDAAFHVEKIGPVGVGTAVKC
jgi:hypothetical protein